MAKKYIVTVSVEERKKLSTLIGSGTEKARKLTHARILQKADEGWQNCEVCKALGGPQEACVIALVCSSPPEGYARWSLRLLADQVVQLNIIDEISHETIRQVLDDNELKPWTKQEWRIPPQANAKFVYMEDILDVYKRPADPKRPLVCFDESPEQLVRETRQALPIARAL